MGEVAVALAVVAGSIALLALAAFAFWRYYWFWRNPERTAPEGENIVAPADGRIVYVQRLDPQKDVICVKQGVEIRVNDITRQDLAGERLLIGIFMSPFNVHYNRAPLSGRVEAIQHYPAVAIDASEQAVNLAMGSMHYRTLLRKLPIYGNSPHIFQNERTVTRFAGQWCDDELTAYVVQIASRNVDGIDSYFAPGDSVEKGRTFGMIRIGSQVDLVVPWRENMEIHVTPGQHVRAGETILIARRRS